MTQTQVQSEVARSYSTGVQGRCIGSSGNHHFVVDYAPHQEGPGDMPAPTHYFLSGVTSCGVLMIEREARHRGVRIDRLDAQIEAFRRSEPDGRPHTTFKRIEMEFTFVGPTDTEAKELIAHYQKTCPLYGSVAEATGDVSVTFKIEPR